MRHRVAGRKLNRSPEHRRRLIQNMMCDLFMHGRIITTVQKAKEVRPHAEKEIGWYDLEPTPHGLRDPLFSHFEACEMIFQWHGDTFDIPEGAVPLITAPTCANQAFRYGERAYGLQFHMEVDAALIERWLSVPVHRAEIEAEGGRICADRIRRDTARHAKRLAELSDQTFTRFIELFGDPQKRGVGPHR